MVGGGIFFLPEHRVEVAKEHWELSWPVPVRGKTIDYSNS